MADIDILSLAIVLGTILVSMTLHEAMHAFVGHWLGDDTAKLQGRLTLNPLSHIDPFTTVLLPLFLVMVGAPPFGAAKPVPFDPRQVRFGDLGAAMVGAAGPLTNLVLAGLGGVFLQLFGASLGAGFTEVAYIFVVVNISFFVFNMIPFPPLDGSRVLYAVAPDPVRAVMERIEAMGFMAIIFFMMLFYVFFKDPFIEIVKGLVSFLIGS